MSLITLEMVARWGQHSSIVSSCHDTRGFLKQCLDQDVPALPSIPCLTNHGLPREVKVRNKVDCNLSRLKASISSVQRSHPLMHWARHPHLHRLSPLSPP